MRARAIAIVLAPAAVHAGGFAVPEQTIAAAGTGGAGRVRFFPLGGGLATSPAFEFNAFDGTRSVYVGGGAKSESV